MEKMYNLKSPAVKRLMREASELSVPTEEYFAYPLEDNLFEWHFTIRGPPGTVFQEGFYHGRILLPPEYPMKPPNIIILTPNGRFELNKKICLSISGHHPETWQPSWSIRTALLALIAFMPTLGNGTIGALDYTPEERKLMARKSSLWECNECGPIVSLFLKTESRGGVRTAKQDECTHVLKVEDVMPPEMQIGTASIVAEEQLDDFTYEEEEEEEVANVPREDSLPIPQIRISESSLHNTQSLFESFSNALIVIIVAAIAFLVYRRLFLIT